MVDIDAVAKIRHLEGDYSYASHAYPDNCKGLNQQKRCSSKQVCIWNEAPLQHYVEEDPGHHRMDSQ
ncbi:hypothetical protein D3C76_1827480 [compost metagenome]